MSVTHATICAETEIVTLRRILQDIQEDYGNDMRHAASWRRVDAQRRAAHPERSGSTGSYSDEVEEEAERKLAAATLAYNTAINRRCKEEGLPPYLRSGREGRAAGYDWEPTVDEFMAARRPPVPETKEMKR
jgi:hypothetical protein